MEKWKDIKGYEGLYQVSNMGNIKSLGRYVQDRGNTYYIKEKMKIFHAKANDYGRLQLYKNGKPKNVYAHRLVAEAFLPNTQNKKTVNHKNGIKTDNRVENLEWATYSENNIHAIETGLNGSEQRRNCKGSIAVEQYDEEMRLIARHPSMREAERNTGVDATSIGHGIRKGWKYGGFIWKYAS
jgi:NUMOD4 motif.